MVRHVCFYNHQLQFPTKHSHQRATDRITTKKEKDLLRFQFLRFTTVTQLSKSAANNIDTENLHNSTFYPSTKELPTVTLLAFICFPKGKLKKGKNGFFWDKRKVLKRL